MTEKMPQGYVPKELEPKIPQQEKGYVEEMEEKLKELKDLYIELASLRRHSSAEKNANFENFEIPVEDWMVEMSKNYKDKIDQETKKVQQQIREERSKINSLN